MTLFLLLCAAWLGLVIWRLNCWRSREVSATEDAIDLMLVPLLGWLWPLAAAVAVFFWLSLALGWGCGRLGALAGVAGEGAPS